MPYDAPGERESWADDKFTFDYDGPNRLIMKSVFDGQTISYSYDLAGRLTSVSDNDRAGGVADRQHRVNVSYPLPL